MTIKELRKVLDAFGNEDAEVIAFNEFAGVLFEITEEFADNKGSLQLFIE